MRSQPENSWSRRRANVRAEAEADVKANKRVEVGEKQAAMAAKSDAEILSELNLKDPDQLQQGDDFASYMMAEVPERLRKRALRTLWRSNPVLACVDDLVDYGDDFKAEWDGADLIKTVYRVGKGMLKDDETEETPAPASEDVNMPDDPPENPEQVNMADALHPPEPEFKQPFVGDGGPAPQIDLASTPQIQPQRMRFEFDEIT